MRYNAFISYSQAADGRLAPAVQSAMHRLAKPWYKLRQLHVFRDKTSLAATSGLWSSIESALNESEWFLYIASPEAATSPWVQREIKWWIEHRSLEKFLILLSAGDLRWNTQKNDFDWKETTAVPDILREKFKEQPLYVDLRWAKDQNHLSKRHSQFRSAILDVVAPITGKPKDELDGEDVRQNRLIRRLTWGIGIALVALTSISVIAAIFAFTQRNEAIQQSKIALARQLAAQAQVAGSDRASQLPLSTLLAAESMRLWPSVEADQVLRHGLALLPQRMAYMAHEEPVYAVAFSPDGKHLRTISRDPLNQIIESLWRWGVSTNRKVKTVRCEPEVLTVTYSLNGEYRATATRQGFVHVRELAADKEIARITIVEAPMPMKIRLSPDGMLLAIADGTGGIYVVDVRTAKHIASLKHTTQVEDLVFSADAKWLAAAGNRTTQPARVWDISTARQIAAVAEKSGVMAVAFSADSQFLATGELYNTARLWKLPSGDELRSIKHDGSVNSVAFSPDGKYLATTTDYGNYLGPARLWDVTTGAEIARVGHSHLWGVSDIVFSPDGRYLATAGGKERSAIVWASAAGEEVARTQQDGQVQDMAFSPDGEHLATAGSDRAAHLWQITSGREVKRIMHQNTVASVAFSPQGKYIATGCWDWTARLWETASGDELARMPHTNHVNSVIFSPDGKYLATVETIGKTVRIWSVPSCRKLATIVHEGQVRNAVFSPDGRYLATAALEKIMRLWTVPNGDEFAALPHRGDVTEVVFSPKGRYLATAARDRVHLWDLTTRQEIATLSTLFADTITFSPDGLWLATASNWSVQVWKVPDGRLQQTLSQDDGARHVAFSPDSRYLATASVDGLTRIYDVVIGRECMKSKLESPPTAIAFSRDGKYLATHTGHSGTAHILLWRSGDLIAEAGTRLGRNLSFDEWRDYFGETPYNKTAPNLPIHSSLIEAGRDLARAGDFKEAVAIFRRASELEPGLDLDPAAEAQKNADAFALLDEGKKLVKQGKVKEAIEAYAQAQEIDPTLVVSAASWNILCRFGSLWGAPSNVMYACENAVALEPSNVLFRDTRGLARALTEDYSGAIEDFQVYVMWGSWGKDEQPEEALRKHQNWIQELEAGRSPFDEATLQALWNDYETEYP